MKEKRKEKGKKRKEGKEEKMRQSKGGTYSLILQTFNYNLIYFHDLHKIQEIYNEKNIIQFLFLCHLYLK